MTMTTQSVMEALFDSLETAAVCALVSATLSATLFIDMRGDGSLWGAVHHYREMSWGQEEIPSQVRLITVPKHSSRCKVYEDRILAILDAPASGQTIAALYQAPESFTQDNTPADFRGGVNSLYQVAGN